MSFAIPALLAAVVSFEGLPSPGSPGSHEAWKRAIRGFDATVRHEAVDAFDAYLREHPSDATAAIERCELLEALTDEEGEPVDSSLPTAQKCTQDLERNFSRSPEALVYRLDRSWGEKAATFGRTALADRGIAFSDEQRAHIHRKIAKAEEVLGHLDAAGAAARQAMILDPTIDLTATIGAQLLSQQRNKEAAVYLSSRPTGTWYELQQKAKQLVAAGAFFRAEWMARRAEAQPGHHSDLMLQASIYEKTGRPGLAREALAKLGAPRNNNPDVLLRLFKLALDGKDAGAAVSAYQKFRDQGWKVDPLARHRLSLQRKVPSARPRARDLLGLATLLAGLLAIALVPMAFLLPLHAWTLWRRLQLPRPDEAPPPSQWWFRHVYLASGLFLMVQVLALYLFDYEEIALWRHAAAERSARASAAATAAFGLGYAVIVSILLAIVIAHRPERFRLLGKGSWSLAKCLRQAALALALSYCVAFLSYWALPGALTLERMVHSMVEIYGLPLSLFAIAVLIPLAEEILFRWILLDVLARNLRFWVANAVQAVLFAALHADPKRLLFYTVVGLLSGRMRRASGGLLPSILFHGANNAIALLLLVAMRTGAVPDKRALQHADPELAACSKARGNPLGNATFALPLNNLAWSIAIDPSSSVPCLRKAEEAIDAALRQVPDGSGFLDTKATVLYRLGRLDEAIEIERAPIDAGKGSKFHLSQVDRFLRAREPGGGPLLIGDAPPSTVTVGRVPSPDGRQIHVQLGSALPDGFVIYAREYPGRGFLTFATGPSNKESYDLVLPMRMPETSTFEVALVDSRGCDDCSAGQWKYEFSPHDPSVDALP